MITVTKHEAKLGNLAAAAEDQGWQTALYDFSISRVLQSLPVPEDQRIADWTYFAPLTDQSSALIIGCGWGEVPITLSKRCHHVTAVDSLPERVDFLKVRQKQQRIDNLEVHLLTEDWTLPFPDASFDFVCVGPQPARSGAFLPFKKAAQRVYQLLKDDGAAFFSAGNRWSVASLHSRTQNGVLSRHTLFGYRSILKKCGFADIQAYAPLPYYDGIPLMNLPLDEPHAIRFFFRHIFPLFEMVSPESKKAYAEYAAARFGVRLLRIFGLESISKYFLTGFSLRAQKPETSC